MAQEDASDCAQVLGNGLDFHAHGPDPGVEQQNPTPIADEVDVHHLRGFHGAAGPLRPPERALASRARRLAVGRESKDAGTSTATPTTARWTAQIRPDWRRSVFCVNL